MSDIAYEKRQHLDTEQAFAVIPSQFNQDIHGIEFLKRLVKKLRNTLIDEHNDKDLKGALVKDKNYDDDDDVLENLFLDAKLPKHKPEDYIDPFKNRAEKWKEVSQSLLDLLNKEANLVKRILSKLQI
ncbi:hypothetical protein IWW36_001181 [Coemansia brasiliensis]|uniref:Uncharacterized protein n=1 Tax=Coemansia brasiliensis TaxID=2650707 RepID=A0A9W8M0P2_9FUNG|nr:hypothetical protein IWW36_001181 [Coemansia brasiliensis]